MMSWTIRPLKVGVVMDLEKPMFTYGSGFGQKVDLTCISWLLEDGNRKILVDTGPGDPAFSSKYHSRLEKSDEDNVINRLVKASVNPQEIELVILTHLHYDHCNSMELLPNARFLVQESELKYAVCPLKAHRRLYEIDIPGVIAPWFKAFDRIVPVNGDLDVEPGLKVILLPGHSIGLQGVRVETKSGMYLIASDCFPLFDNLTSEEGMIPSGLHINLESYYSSMEKVKQLGDIVLPGHDADVLKHEVYGR